MDPLIFVILIVVILATAIFNYYLNLAPGTDPDDFQVGPPQLNITCDCSLNILILGGILVLALSAGSSMFDSRIELILTGVLAFAAVTIAGFFGRYKRHREWREFDRVIRRVVPQSHLRSGIGSVDIIFDDDDDDEFDLDEY